MRRLVSALIAISAMAVNVNTFAASPVIYDTTTEATNEGGSAE